MLYAAGRQNLLTKRVHLPQRLFAVCSRSRLVAELEAPVSAVCWPSSVGLCLPGGTRRLDYHIQKTYVDLCPFCPYWD